MTVDRMIEVLQCQHGTLEHEAVTTNSAYQSGPCNSERQQYPSRTILSLLESLASAIISTPPTGVNWAADGITIIMKVSLATFSMAPHVDQSPATPSLLESSIGDHFYNSPIGMNLAVDGMATAMKALPVIAGHYAGTRPLYRYWNSRIGDHFYTTVLMNSVAAVMATAAKGLLATCQVPVDPLASTDFSGTL